MSRICCVDSRFWLPTITVVVFHLAYGYCSSSIFWQLWIVWNIGKSIVQNICLYHVNLNLVYCWIYKILKKLILCHSIIVYEYHIQVSYPGDYMIGLLLCIFITFFTEWILYLAYKFVYRQKHYFCIILGKLRTPLELPYFFLSLLHNFFPISSFHQDVLGLRGWRLSSKTRDQTISPWMRR